MTEFLVYKGLPITKRFFSCVSHFIFLLVYFGIFMSVSIQIDILSEQLKDPVFQKTLDTPEEINTKYIITKELGKGAYGTVYLAEDRQSGEQ